MYGLQSKPLSFFLQCLKLLLIAKKTHSGLLRCSIMGCAFFKFRKWTYDSSTISAWWVFRGSPKHIQQAIWSVEHTTNSKKQSLERRAWLSPSLYCSYGILGTLGDELVVLLNICKGSWCDTAFARQFVLNLILSFAHCQAECKQISMWQKGLIGQCWAVLTLNFNFHCLIQ